MREFFKEKAALIITEPNRLFISGFSSSLGYLFVIGNKKILYVDGRYFEAAKNGVYQDVEVRLLKKLSDAIFEIYKEFSYSSLLLEADISVREFENIKPLVPNSAAACSTELSDALLEFRSVKSDEQVDKIITAQRFSEKAFDNILSFIRAGVTEKQIAAELEYYMKKAGSDGVSFETIAVSGANTSKPHGVPTDKPIENGDFITMDFGATYQGYHSDMTRTVAVGYATDEMQLVYETVLKAQLNALEKIKSGALACEIDKAARDVIAASGYGEYFTHSTGHGVGLEIHEKPNISSNNKQLQSGNIITVEPGIYIEGKFGVRIEDMLKVTPNGAQNLTNSKKSLIILK